MAIISCEKTSEKDSLTFFSGGFSSMYHENSCQQLWERMRTELLAFLFGDACTGDRSV